MIRIPNIFYPKFKCDLIRLGNNHDGGYVVEKNSIKNSEVLISFGLSDDWSFEEDFSKPGTKKIYSYDYSVNKRFWAVNFIKSLISIFFLKKPFKNFVKLFDYFQYKFFFDKKNNFHFKKFITPLSMKKNLFDKNLNEDLNNILKKIDKEIFLKIDIEGSEYRILDQIKKNYKKINGMVIEFHDFDLHHNLIHKFIKNFELNLVHLHVNNFGFINEEGLPSVVELTFVSKKFFKNDLLNDKIYPIESLDMPCNKDEVDHNITFYQ